MKNNYMEVKNQHSYNVRKRKRSGIWWKLNARLATRKQQYQTTWVEIQVLTLHV